MSDPVVTHVIEHGDPSPLPEPAWLWRRLYVWGASATLAAHIFWTSLRTSDVATLRETIRNDQGLILLFALLYLAGASAEAIAAIIGAIRTARRETITTTPGDGQ